MKKILALALFSIFIFIGCQDDSSILEPTDNYTEGELSKGRPIFNYDTSDLKLSDDSGDLVVSDNTVTTLLSKKADSTPELYRSLPIDIKTNVSKNLTINGDLGAIVYLSHKWKNANNKTCKLSAKLDIPIGAFSGDLTFEIIFDLNNYAVELYPSPFTFDKPVLLDLVFKNVDLSNIDPNAFVFDYLDGEEPVNLKVKSFDIDIKKNTLSIKDAELHHFSRYGWTRTR